MNTKKTAAAVKKPDPAKEAFEKAVTAGHRLPESEAIILGSKSGDLMYRYVKTVLKGPWPEAEPWIAELDADTVISYIQCYRGSRWRKAERIILARRHPQDLYSYALVVLQSPWPAAEPLLLQSNNSEWIIAYAHNVRLGRWPAGEDWVIAHGRAESWARLLVWDNVLDARLARKCTCWRFLFAKYVIDCERRSKSAARGGVGRPVEKCSAQLCSGVGQENRGGAAISPYRERGTRSVCSDGDVD